MQPKELHANPPMKKVRVEDGKRRPKNCEKTTLQKLKK